MEKREGKVTFSKSGNGIGAKVALSIPLLKKFGITQETREIEIVYDEKNQVILIKKK